MQRNVGVVQNFADVCAATCRFSPLGKLANQAIYFACVNFFLYLNADKLPQDPLDLFL